MHDQISYNNCSNINRVEIQIMFYKTVLSLLTLSMPLPLHKLQHVQCLKHSLPCTNNTKTIYTHVMVKVFPWLPFRKQISTVVDRLYFLLDNRAQM